jgi:hypothetical protein
MSMAVLPKTFFKTFFCEFNAIYGQDGYKAGFASIKDRTCSPLADYFSHFASPYRKGSEFSWNFLAGPVAGFGLLVPYVTGILLIIPAIGELLISMSSFAKAIFYLSKGEKEQASAFFRDGLMRFMLTPCLALLCVIAVPLECIRFLVRCVSTLVHVVRACFRPGEEVVMQVEPTEPRPLGSGSL